MIVPGEAQPGGRKPRLDREQARSERFPAFDCRWTFGRRQVGRDDDLDTQPSRDIDRPLAFALEHRDAEMPAPGAETVRVEQPLRRRHVVVERGEGFDIGEPVTCDGRELHLHRRKLAAAVELHAEGMRQSHVVSRSLIAPTIRGARSRRRLRRIWSSRGADCRRSMRRSGRRTPVHGCRRWRSQPSP